MNPYNNEVRISNAVKSIGDVLRHITLVSIAFHRSCILMLITVVKTEDASKGSQEFLSYMEWYVASTYLAQSIYS